MKKTIIILLSVAIVVVVNILANRNSFAKTISNKKDIQIIIGFHGNNAIFDIIINSFEVSIQLLKFSFVIYNHKNIPF